MAHPDRSPIITSFSAQNKLLLRLFDLGTGRCLRASSCDLPQEDQPVRGCCLECLGRCLWCLAQSALHRTCCCRVFHTSHACIDSRTG